MNIKNKPYRPSNSTEGELFMSKFCYRCCHDWNECEILTNSLCYNIDEPEYPVEWIYDENGKPTCTKFKKKE